MSKAAAFLLVLGLSQMTGDLLEQFVSRPAGRLLKGVAAATTASPAPRVFSAVRGLETYSTRFFVEWTDRRGNLHSLLVTPEVCARLHGPYNRRNVYGAALSYGPVLPAELRDPVMRYAVCGDAPLLRELGIDPDDVRGPVRIRYEPLPGTDMGDFPRILEALPMNTERLNGWTGGQYSLFRILFGSYLLVHFAQLIPWGAELFSNQGVLPDASASPLLYLFPNVLALSDAPATVTALLAAGVGLSILFAVGLYDRAAALGLWYIWACLFGRDPLIANPSLPFVGWLLLAHVFLPPAPYGSWAARGRIDPGGGWRMPQAIWAAAWIVMAVGYSYSGYTKLISPSWRDGTALARVLDNPLARPGFLREALLGLPAWMLHAATWAALALELGFAPLALVGRLRPWLWGLMLMMHLSLILVVDFADLSLGMVMFHLFTFDPGWIRPRPGGTERLFYDGHCGLCQRSVRLILAEDRPEEAFRFAPLQGETFQAAVAEKERQSLPTSIVVQTQDGVLLTRSAAVLHIMRRLGGVWRLLAGMLALVPTRLRDQLYDGVAAVRRRLFARPETACPLLPPRLRARFDP